MIKKIGLSLAITTALFTGAVTAGVEEIVTVATRTEANLAEVIGSVSVVDTEVLKLVSHAHVQQALSRVAGVNLHRGNGQEYLPAVRSPVLTGAGGCGGFLMQEDGIPIRAAGFCNINELFEANTEMAQRIEVLRGTGTVLHGSNAMHGVINIVTPEISQESNLGLEVGANDYGRLKFKSGTETLGIAANLTHDGGYRDDSGFDQQKVSLRHAYKSGDVKIDSGITLTNLNQETAGFIEGLDSYKDDAQVELNLNPEAYRDVRSARVWSRISKAEQNYKLIVTPYLRYSKMDFLQHFLPGDPLEENGQKSLGVQVGYYRALSDTLNVIAGFDAEITDAYLKQSQDSPTIGSFFLRSTIPMGQHYDYQVDATMAAPYMHLDWSVNDQLSVSGGLRFESMRYDYSNNMLAGRTKADGSLCQFGCRYSRPESGKDNFNNWSSNLGAQFKLSDTHSTFVRLARGFRAPQATELYRLQRAQQITDLDSESVDSVELGIAGDTESLSYKVAVYHMEKDNVIFRDSSFFNVSDGKTEHQGIELELDYEINSQWSVGISATQARHTYLSDTLVGAVDSLGNGVEVNINNNDIDTAPRNFGSARLVWTPDSTKTVELEWQSMGSYQLNPENFNQYEGHDIAHLRAGWDVSESIRVYANISNLTDEQYAERADFTTFSQERYFPGTPRSMQVGVELAW
ncbi:TonB-dependent receptor [Porticoccaceae bacterium]|nr:TonB-dependent receptor [Porticoccaceae bacterium]